MCLNTSPHNNSGADYNDDYNYNRACYYHYDYDYHSTPWNNNDDYNYDSAPKQRWWRWRV
jgi:hypothetical protein